MAPLPAPRPLPLAERTSLSPPPPPPPGPPFTRPRLRAERINRPRLFGGHPRGPAPPSPRAHGSGAREAAAGQRPHGRGAALRGKRGVTGLGGWAPAGEGGPGAPRPPRAGWFLLVAPRGVGRGGNEARSPETRPAPGEAAAHARSDRGPPPRGAGHRVGGSGGAWGGGARFSAPGRAGRTRSGGAQARRSPLRPPRRPWRSRKPPIVRREIHFGGPSESPSFF